jgi:hypothetical protein
MIPRLGVVPHAGRSRRIVLSHASPPVAPPLEVLERP